MKKVNQILNNDLLIDLIAITSNADVDNKIFVKVYTVVFNQVRRHKVIEMRSIVDRAIDEKS